MDEKRPKVGLRFGLPALMVAIAALAVLFSVWNPLRHRHAMVDFQERTIFGTPPDEIVQVYGLPARRVKTRTGFVLIYEAIDGKVAVNFENQKVEGIAWSGEDEKGRVGFGRWKRSRTMSFMQTEK